MLELIDCFCLKSARVEKFLHFYQKQKGYVELLLLTEKFVLVQTKNSYKFTKHNSTHLSNTVFKQMKRWINLLSKQGLVCSAIWFHLFLVIAVVITCELWTIMLQVCSYIIMQTFLIYANSTHICISCNFTIFKVANSKKVQQQQNWMLS